MSHDVRREGGNWFPLFLLSLTITNGLAAQSVFAALQELAKHDLALSDFQLSLLQGLACSIPIAALSLPLGRLVDRGNRVRLLLAMIATWTAGSLLSAYAASFPMLFLARMLAGMGMMCSLPVAISIAADLTPPQRRGFALLLLSIGKIVGVALAFALGGGLVGWLATHPPAWLAQLAPWRGVQLLFGLANVALGLPLLLLREPPRHELGAAASAPFGATMRALWQRRALLVPLFLGQLTVTMADAAAAAWAAPVLVRNYHQQPAEFGNWIGLVLLLSGLGGSIVGGLAADLGQKGRIRGGILGSAMLASFLAIPGAFFPVMPDVTGFAWMLGLLLIAGAVTGVVTATALAVVVPNEMRGLCISLFIVVGAILGLGLAPTLVTLVGDALGGERMLDWGLTLVSLVTSTASAVGFVIALRHEAQWRPR